MHARHDGFVARVAAAFAAVAALLCVTVLGLSGQSQAVVATVRRPIDVIVVVDTSRRDIPFHFTTIARAAAATIRAIPSEARVGIVTTGPFPAVVWPLAAKRVGTSTVIATLKAAGNAQILDAMSLAVDQFDVNTSPTRTIVVVGDGRSGGNSVSLAELRKALVKNKVTVDFVTVNVAPPNEPLIRALLTSKSQRASIGNLGSIGSKISERSVVTLKPIRGRTGLHIPRGPIVAVAVAVLLGSVGVLAALLAQPKSIRLNADATVVEGREGATPFTEVSHRLSSAVDQALEQSGRSSSINDALETAGVNLRAGEYITMIGALMIAGGGFGFVTKGPIAGAVLAVLVLLGGFMMLRMKAKRRKTAFSGQLGDTLQLLSSSMRAGQSLIQALDAVAKEGEAPAAEEFRRVIVETRLGRDLIDSLHALATRMECDDLRWVIPAIEINRTVGGDLGEVLDNVGQTIRDRADVRRQVKTLSAEGRMSAYVLLGMPIVVGIFLRKANPEYVDKLFHGTGLYMLGGGCVLMFIGTIWMLHLCNIKF